MRSISILGVLVGSIFDIFLSSLIAIGLVYLFVTSGFDGQGTTFDLEKLNSVVDRSVVLTTALYISGPTVSITAGYIAAAIAKRHELLNGALSSVLCLAASFLTLFNEPTSHSVGYYALEFLVSPLAGTLGGYLRRERANKRARLR